MEDSFRTELAIMSDLLKYNVFVKVTAIVCIVWIDFFESFFYF